MDVTYNSITYASRIQDKLDYEAFDEKYELDPKNLTILHKLGSGHFGDVHMGILNSHGAKIPVAVKKTKLNIQENPENHGELSHMERESLRDELKIMAHMGEHSNVVRLLGAITKCKDDYCVITEYCEYGSLNTFLRNKKDLCLFIDEIVIEDNVVHHFGSRDFVYKSVQDVTWASNFELRRAEGMLSTSDLLWFALQMARAMEYLTNHSVVHRDVALRNVLLKSDYTLKVADFGLSRLASDDGYYYHERNVALPIPYTAPEAMKFNRFSEHSECWAYGVALWELFTFSKKQPYAEECPESYQSIMTFLAAGNRLRIPETAPKPIRLMIAKLWHDNPAKRPCFSDCQSDISKELNVSCPQILIRMKLEKDLMSVKNTSNEDAEIAQELQKFLLKKRRKIPAKKIRFKIVSQHQARRNKFALYFTSVAAGGTALVAIISAVLWLSQGKIQDTCFAKPIWTTKNGHVLLNGEQLVLKGVNYNGFETTDYSPYGLSKQSLDFLLDIIAENDFNAVRLTFSIEMIQRNPKPKNVDCTKNPEICHLKSLDLMEALIDRCANRGLLVVLVCSQLSAGSSYNDRNGIWYDPTNEMYSEEKVLAAWDELMMRVRNKWNLFGLDILDQPHRGASWEGNDKQFNRYAERFIEHISSKHAEFTGFFFIEGVHITHTKEDEKIEIAAFDGENLVGVHTYPISTKDKELDERIIYSPHTFGPSLSNENLRFKSDEFPANMPKIWDNYFGFITAQRSTPVIVGSWGGKFENGTADEQWHNAFVDWLKSKCLTNQFYWCLNGFDSLFGDALLSDMAKLNQRKLALLKRLQPNPSKFVCYKATSELRILPETGILTNELCYHDAT